jgi:hypothetical protein
VGEKLVAGPQQEVGYRFEIGITTLADAERYQLQTASLQTTPATFVAPDTTSLEATAALLRQDATSGTWPIPYAEFDQSAGAAAYPGAMVVYAAIPTEGLPSTDAADYAALLRFAVTTGQTPGSGVGQLPSGYLPLTAADGLGALAHYTLLAATDVAAQNGQLPSDSVATSKSSQSAPAGGGTSPIGGDGFENVPFTTSETGLAFAQAVQRRLRQHVPTHAVVTVIQPTGLTVGLTSWAGESVILLLALAGCVGLFGIPILLLLGRRRGRW